MSNTGYLLFICAAFSVATATTATIVQEGDVPNPLNEPSCAAQDAMAKNRGHTG